MGKPELMERTGQNREDWIYNVTAFPATGGWKGAYVTGLSLFLTNQTLADWSFNYSYLEKNNDRTNLTPEKGDTNSAILKFFVISNVRIENGKFINTPSFPKLGFIGPKADLTVSKLESADIGEEKPSAVTGSNRWIYNLSRQK
ncbi:MAG TPA: hypothetical protein VH413_02835 [Verrucomicrobiae bacterium]|jgi:hypothetical protein|nr:hypothetical protein [Verrucomicrobiae bacterium]